MSAALNDLIDISHISLYFNTLHVFSQRNNVYTNYVVLFVLGSHIGTSIFGIHRNASIWENPDVSPLKRT